MINFAVGPVQMQEGIRAIGAEPVPYFRTPEFSSVMKENERILKKLAKAPSEARAVFLTGSGTAAMESVVMHVFSKDDRVLVVNGGTFGQRFADLCKIHEVPFSEIVVPSGKNITEEMLRPFENQGYTGFLINVHETSTGVLYDLELASSFCRRNHLLFVADAISSFLADAWSMEACGMDVMIVSSQKGLACPPGVSMVVLSEKAAERVQRHPTKSLYLDLKGALLDGERGQTPFTPAVGILLQMRERFRQLERCGVEAEVERVRGIAEDFRQKISGLPFRIASESLSNALTPLEPVHGHAFAIFTRLKDEYNIWVCPNGGVHRDTLFRVGHIGALTKEDNTKLVNALRDMAERGLL